MAYKTSFNYRGGPKKTRREKEIKKITKRIGWIALWVFIGMLVTHFIFSIAVKTKQTVGELASTGIAPIATIQDEANAKGSEIFFLPESLADSYQVDSYISSLLKKGIKTVIIDVKGENGILTYASRSATAASLAAVPEGVPDMEKLMVKFNNAGIGVFARLSLYADDLAVAKNPALSGFGTTQQETFTLAEDGTQIPAYETVTSATPWLDKNGHSWLSPYQSFATDYAKELITELSGYGIKGVMLRNIHFPSADLGDANSVIFSGEAESELPRAGALRQNISILYSTAQSLGVELIVQLEAEYCAGMQDTVAGFTFNVFELKADAISPSMILSDLEASGNRSFGDYTFESARTANISELTNAICASCKLMQGAVENPPRIMPIIDARSDPATRFRELTPDDMTAIRNMLNSHVIAGRVFYGSISDYGTLFADVC